MIELAIWLYHIGSPDPAVRAVTDAATVLLILWGIVNHYAAKEADRAFKEAYREMLNWKAVAHYHAKEEQRLLEILHNWNDWEQ